MATILSQITLGDLTVAHVDSDPSVSPGLVLPVGSIAVVNTGDVGKTFLKAGSGNTSWIEIRIGLVDLASQITGVLPVSKGGTNAATAVDALTSLGAVAKAGDTMTGPLILNTDPSNVLGAATKQYVDSNTGATNSWKTSARVGTTANLTATYNNGSSGIGATLTNSGAQAALSLDGVTLAINDRVLVKNQTDTKQNGIYVVTNTGSNSTNWVLTRSTDANSASTLLTQSTVKISEGSTLTLTSWSLSTTGTITIGTSNIVWAQTTGQFNPGNRITRYISLPTISPSSPNISMSGTSYTAALDLAFNPADHVLAGSTTTFIFKAILGFANTNQAANVRLFNVNQSTAVTNSTISIPSGQSTTATIFSSGTLTSSDFGSGENVFECQVQKTAGSSGLVVYGFELVITSTF